ncbi:MAG: hypothetical protein P8X74_20905 [Reinekea sp.]
MLAINNKEAVFDTAIGLSDSSIFICTKGDDELDNTLTALENAKSDEEASRILKGGVRIAYANIDKVVCNIKSEMIYIKHRDGKEKRSQSLSCQDQSTTEKVLLALKERNPGFSEKREQLGIFRSSIKPTIFIAISIFGTYIFYVMASVFSNNTDIDVGGRKSFIKKVFVWVLESLGPTGVAIVGGIITLSFVIWLIKRIKNPPLMCVLSST